MQPALNISSDMSLAASARKSSNAAVGEVGGTLVAKSPPMPTGSIHVGVAGVEEASPSSSWLSARATDGNVELITNRKRKYDAH